MTSQTRTYYHLDQQAGNASDHSLTSFASPYKQAYSPANSMNMQQRSPMTTTLATLSWVKDLVISVGDGPTPTLLSFFQCCTRDLTSDIVNRVQKLSGPMIIH